jgi:hypothetical protein
MAMQDKAGQVTVLRTFAIILFLFALGIMGAQIFGGLDISIAIPISLMTVGISNLVIAQSVSKGSDEEG